jgi:outer membrane protein OmpA-like peptidoglycan-associated protein
MMFRRPVFALITLFVVFSAHAQQLRTVQKIEGIPDRVEYRALTHDPDGNLYVATSADVFMIPAAGYQAQAMQVGDQVVDVDWSGDYGLIMLFRDGRVRFAATGQELTFDAGEAATCMDLTKSLIWVGTKNGVYTVSIPQERVVDHYTIEDGTLKSNEVNFIHTDPHGIRWVGTEAGVARIEKNKWKLYEEKQSFHAVTSTEEGAWMAAKDEMWLVSQFNRWYPIDAWRDLVSGPVKALSSDQKGIIYIASEWLVKYDPYQEKILSLNEGHVAEEVVLLDKGPGNNVWMAGHNGLSRVIEDTTMSGPPLPGAAFTATVSVLSGAVCPGTTTGRLSVKAEGGTPPYTYKWSNGGMAAEMSALAPGVYQVTITDQAAKTVVSSAIIPAAPAMTLLATADGRSSDKLAADGKASISITGGEGPYRIAWDNGETVDKALKLTPGTHTVRVSDLNGCETTAAVVIEAEKVLKSLDIATIALGQTIRVEKLYFEADSSTIQPASFAVLSEIHDFLAQNPNIVVEIGGHTNSLPEDAYCDRLSTSRAKNVAEYLYDTGIPEKQISYKGYGKRQPIATNQTVDGRRKNQRVEIKIISM